MPDRRREHEYTCMADSHVASKKGPCRRGTTIGRIEYLAAYGFKCPDLFLGRVHTAAGSGLSAFRLACAYACGTVRKPVLVVAADLGSQATDHPKVIWQTLDPLREHHVPMNGVSLFAFMASSYLHSCGVTVNIR